LAGTAIKAVADIAPISAVRRYFMSFPIGLFQSKHIPNDVKQLDSHAVRRNGFQNVNAGARLIFCKKKGLTKGLNKLSQFRSDSCRKVSGPQGGMSLCNTIFSKVENRSGQHGISVSFCNTFHQMIERTNTAARNHRDRYRIGNGAG